MVQYRERKYPRGSEMPLADEIEIRHCSQVLPFSVAAAPTAVLEQATSYVTEAGPHPMRGRL
jgi:hypothetical protein